MPEPRPSEELPPEEKLDSEELKLEEKSGEFGNVVENKELGVSYIETIEELPVETQETTGVKKLRRRKVISYPDNFYSDKLRGWRHKSGFEAGSENSFAILNFLTDGRMPSYKTWNHMMSGDIGGQHGDKLIDEFHKGEGVFQEFFPEFTFEFNLQHGFSPIEFFEKDKKGGITKLDFEKIKKMSSDDARETLSLFDMCVTDEGNFWTNVIDSPTFAFGNRNKLFVDYIEAIKRNPETRTILELGGWELNDPLELIDANSPDYEKYKKLFWKEGRDYARMRPKIDFPEEYLTGKWGGSIRPGKEHEEDKRISDAVITASKSVYRNISSLNFLLDEKDVKYYGGYPAQIPVVRHPDIKPLRWSHAELAVIPKGKELEVVFFETGDEEQEK